MTQGKPHRRRRSGILASTRPGGKSQPTPLWQWIVGIPVLLLLAGMLVVFVWINFFRPDIKMDIRTATLPVAGRGEDPGGLSGPRPWLSVRIEKKDVHLPATAEQTARLKDGEMVVVRYRFEAGTTMVMGWNPAPDPAKPTPGSTGR